MDDTLANTGKVGWNKVLREELRWITYHALSLERGQCRGQDGGPGGLASRGSRYSLGIPALPGAAQGRPEHMAWMLKLMVSHLWSRQGEDGHAPGRSTLQAPVLKDSWGHLFIPPCPREKSDSLTQNLTAGYRI